MRWRGYMLGAGGYQVFSSLTRGGGGGGGAKRSVSALEYVGNIVESPVPLLHDSGCFRHATP